MQKKFADIKKSRKFALVIMKQTLLRITIKIPPQLSWLEHLTVNQRVTGSSPVGGARSTYRNVGAFVFIKSLENIQNNKL